MNNMEQSEKGKSWLYRLRYLKMWKNTNPADATGTSEVAPLNNQRLSNNFNEFQTVNGRNDNPLAFRRNFTTNSLDGHSELTRTDSQLRKSLRKWHRRMKNCFSKNTRHMADRQTTHISPAPASSNSSRVMLATQSYTKENIYSLDPLQFQHNSRSPTSDHTTTISTALSPSISPSRVTLRSENIPTPSRTLDRNRHSSRASPLGHTPPPRILPLEPLRVNTHCSPTSSLVAQSPLRTSPQAQSPLRASPPAQSPFRSSPLSQSPLGTPPLAQSTCQTVRTPSPEERNVPMNEVASLAYCTWYWGPASRSQVEKKLSGAPDGSFLVRDSTSDRYIFSISFRSVGVTLHSRIEYTSRNGYKLFDHEGYSSVKELIEQAVEVSKNNIYCYTKNRGESLPNYPVRLTKPISRYDQVRSLQNLARFVIRQNVNLNDIDHLNLPATLVGYLKEETIF